MKLIIIIIFICLVVLLGTGAQFFLTLGTMDFNVFTPIQWIFQSIYFMLLVCCGIVWGYKTYVEYF